MKELKAELANAEKSLAKPNGFQRSRGFVYCFVGDFAYWIDCNIDLSTVSGSIWVVSVSLNELFWDIFEMPENRNAAKSLHVNGAFTSKFYNLPERFEVALSDSVEAAYAKLIGQMTATIERYSGELRTVEDFQSLIKDNQYQELNLILADIYLGHTQEAKQNLMDAIARNVHGGFGGPKGSIYEYAIAYLERAENLDSVS
jgi:hypothetical protein